MLLSGDGNVNPPSQKNKNHGCIPTWHLFLGLGKFLYNLFIIFFSTNKSSSKVYNLKTCYLELEGGSNLVLWRVICSGNFLHVPRKLNPQLYQMIESVLYLVGNSLEWWVSFHFKFAIFVFIYFKL